MLLDEARRQVAACLALELATLDEEVAAAGHLPAGLTARELEVLRLVAVGLPDARIADDLVVSVRTVHAHLRSIYRKLGVSTRSAATRYALEHEIA